MRAIILAAALIGGSAAHAQSADIEPPFETWRSNFEARLIAQGVDADITASMMTGLEPDMRIIERDRTQPERVRPLWEYLELAASAERAANGRAAAAEITETLAQIEARYGVEAEIVTAIWGLESAYGAIQGDNDIVRSLATLAWEGRRRDWAEAQLFAVAEMLERGYAERDELRGSWAGAMGQTQFIPTTYLDRAVDFDGDGDRDIWRDRGDALASAANLLAEAGWTVGAPVAVEARLPEDFDYAAWSEAAARPLSEWRLAGVERADGGDWRTEDLYLSARLILPAGARGPAFFAFPNFDVARRYNNSTSYVLGITYLSKKIDGEGAIVQTWPTDDPPLSYSQAIALQEALNALGHNAGRADGLIGPNTRSALRAFQSERGYLPDGYAGQLMYDAVIAAAAAPQSD